MGLLDPPNWSGLELAQIVLLTGPWAGTRAVMSRGPNAACRAGTRDQATC